MLDELDRKILTKIQSDFPISKSPYKTLAEQLNCSEDQLFQRMISLQDAGYIRRLGGVFDTKKMGFYTTLVAAKVASDKVDQVATCINQYPGVTHNYQRDHEFNLWFTMAVVDKEELSANLATISELDGVERIIELPAIKLYKLGVKLPMN